MNVIRRIIIDLIVTLGEWMRIPGADDHRCYILEPSALHAVARSAQVLVDEMRDLGYGLTVDKPYPGSIDGLLLALDNLKATLQ